MAYRSFSLKEHVGRRVISLVAQSIRHLAASRCESILLGDLKILRPILPHDVYLRTLHAFASLIRHGRSFLGNHLKATDIDVITGYHAMKLRNVRIGDPMRISVLLDKVDY